MTILEQYEQRRLVVMDCNVAFSTDSSEKHWSGSATSCM